MAAVLLLNVPTSLVAGHIAGDAARFERIKGKPYMGYVEVCENNLFLSPPDDLTIGPHRRLGTVCLIDTPSGLECLSGHNPGGGCYCVDNMPGGTYSILVNQPEFFVRPAVAPNVLIPDNQRIIVNVDIPIDYSTYFDLADGQWTGPDRTWYQTYTATGTSVTGVAFVLAGTSAASATVSILRDNGNANPVNWTLVGSRQEPGIGNLTDNWVRWRSGEIPTIPGVRYAVKVEGNDGNIQPLKRNKDGNSYVGGRAYNAAGQAQNFDLQYVVFADNDGTICTVNKRTGGIGTLRDGYFSTKWGQTFTAGGTSLAAVDCWAAGANNRWDLDFKWRIRADGPNGDQIGPTKITHAGFFGAGAGLHGVSYSHDEVPLRPRQTYFIEFSIYDPPPESNGFNPYITDDPYGGGIGYQWNGTSWDAKTNRDVAMTVVEYAPTTPLIELNKTSFSHTIVKGGSLPADTFTVSNIGIDTLNYTMTDGVAWLGTSPDSGSSTGEADLIRVNYNVSALPKGFHMTDIIVSDPNAEDSPKTIRVQIEVITLVRVDFDGDDDVDQEDFGVFQGCMTGSGVPQPDPDCFDARLDDDEDVDGADFTIFADCMSGPGTPADPTCDD